MAHSKLLLLCLLCLMGARASAALTVTSDQALSFGKFAAGTGGSVTITPAGSRTSTGGVSLLSDTAGHVAIFTVSDADPLRAVSSYTITLPANGSVELAGSSSAMAVNDFKSDPADTGVLTNGTQTIRVGATLVVQAGQAPDNYAGLFSIIIEYQ